MAELAAQFLLLNLAALFELTKLARYGIQPVDAFEPKIPPMTPAMTAIKRRLRL
jgi:hypothetical protein